jgi:protein-L-isoaspartate(D-aspartate) O-methyltransferase
MQHERTHMVQTQLIKRGICNQAVLDAMNTVPRHLFLPEHLQLHAYEDRALPIASDQTISQPFIVALMAEALSLSAQDRVLEIGTGSGYSAAIMSLLAHEVYSVERFPEMARAAQERLLDLGYHNVHVVTSDGTSGLPAHAPYDAISVAAASPWVPLPLRQQLADKGRLVIPVGSRDEQLLLRLQRTHNTIRTEQFGGVRFVPLLGEHAWEN